MLQAFNVKTSADATRPSVTYMDSLRVVKVSVFLVQMATSHSNIRTYMFLIRVPYFCGGVLLGKSGCVAWSGIGFGQVYRHTGILLAYMGSCCFSFRTWTVWHGSIAPDYIHETMNYSKQSILERHLDRPRLFRRRSLRSCGFPIRKLAFNRADRKRAQSVASSRDIRPVERHSKQCCSASFF
jgi:hypothetical protein